MGQPERMKGESEWFARRRAESLSARYADFRGSGRERGYPERAGCLGWPEVGSCERPAMGNRNRNGRVSAQYCSDCDEARRLHERKPGALGDDSDLIEAGEEEADE